MAFMGKFSKCPLCHKEFSTSGSLSKHKKRVHKVMPDPTKAARVGRQVKCGEKDCPYVATRRDDMRDHLVLEHGFALVEVQEEFESMLDFREWMDFVARANRTQFAARASDTQARATVHRYVCHRSGLSNLKTTARRRRVKSQGSCKMGGWCTAYLNARECLLTGAVRVNGCLTHYGHDMDVAHLRISAADRKAILAEIRRGVPFDRILEDIRSDFPQDSRDITRTHLITMGDIRNIAVSEGLLSWKLDVDGDRSVRKLAARFAGQSYSPILFYKARGASADDVEAGTLGALRALAEDDMALVIQTRYQRDLVGKEPALVCVEPVTGHSSEYSLLALLATTAAGLVVPIAWCVCGVANPAIVAAFFSALRQNMDDVAPRFFMSEDADFYYSAWLDAFGSVHKPHKLLSTWHVQRVWNDAINTWVRGREKQAAVNKSLELLIRQESPDALEKMLRRVISMLKQDSDTASFGDVFESTFAARAEQWGNCFFQDLEINIEDFHALFRRIANRLKVKRLDKIVHNLLLASDSKQYENYLKVVRQMPPKEATPKKAKDAVVEVMHTVGGVPVEVVTLDPLLIGETVSIDTVTYEAVATDMFPLQVVPMEAAYQEEVLSEGTPIETMHVEEVTTEAVTEPSVTLDLPSAPDANTASTRMRRPRRSKSSYTTTRGIWKVHQEALSMPPECVTRVSDLEWTVSDENETYTVFDAVECGDAECEPRCRQCNACFHRYSCSCGSSYMCRHVHACLIHATPLMDEPVGLVEEVVNTMSPEALADCSSFSFSSINRVAKTSVQNNSKKLDVFCALQKLNEACIRTAELLATNESLPLNHQVEYILSTLKATNAVLNSFCHKGAAQMPKNLTDHDYEGMT